MKIFFASGNKGKYKEICSIFNEYEVDFLGNYPDFPDIVEDGETFEDNAKIKAFAVYNKFKVPVIADDSGICVEQLNGEPGVYSARYAGENCTYDDNNKKMLDALKNFPLPHFASFISCAVYFDGINYLTVTGELKGKIINEKIGDLGFGYDPIFVPDGFEKTFAQLTTDEKNKISHRGKAFIALKSLLKEKKLI